MLSKPWFSRKQLNIIIVVTTLVIAILSTTGPKPLPTVKQYSHSSPAVFYVEKDTPVNRLRFSFKLPEAGHSSQFMPQLLYQLTINRLKQKAIGPEDGWPLLTLSLQHDRLQIQLTGEEAPSAEKLEQMMSWLSADFANDLWYENAKFLKADRYIQHNSEPSPIHLLAPLIGIPLVDDSDDLDTSYQQKLFNRNNVTISFLGPDSESWLTAATKSIEQLSGYSSRQPTTDLWPYPSKLNQPLKGYQSVLAVKTAGLVGDAQPVEQTAVQLILQFRGPTLSADWQPKQNAGLLLLASQQWDAPNLLDDLSHKIESLENEQIDLLVNAQTDALEAMKEQPEQLLDRIEAIGLYQLPLDYLPTLEEAFNNLDALDVKNSALDLLAEGDYYWISK